jgi:hypothetical protein
MEKIVKLTESQLKKIIQNVINEDDSFGILNKKTGMMEDGGFGILSKKTEVSEEGNAYGGGGTSFTSFLQQQGFKDWSQGKPNSYGMKFHYISRKPSTPANLSCSVGQELNSNGISIDILFNGIIERAERYSSGQEYMSKSPIAKIERLVGKDFNWNNVEDDSKSRYSLQIKGVNEKLAKEIILLYNKIRMVGPYSIKK